MGTTDPHGWADLWASLAVYVAMVRSCSVHGYAHWHSSTFQWMRRQAHEVTRWLNLVGRPTQATAWNELPPTRSCQWLGGAGGRATCAASGRPGGVSSSLALALGKCVVLLLHVIRSLRWPEWPKPCCFLPAPDPRVAVPCGAFGEPVAWVLQGFLQGDEGVALVLEPGQE